MHPRPAPHLRVSFHDERRKHPGAEGDSWAHVAEHDDAIRSFVAGVPTGRSSAQPIVDVRRGVDSLSWGVSEARLVARGACCSPHYVSVTRNGLPFGEKGRITASSLLFRVGFLDIVVNIQDCSADDRVILIVEDEATLAFLIQLVMEEVGISALMFGAAEDALEVLRQGKHNVQLILTDVNLAGEMNGVGFSVLLACEFPTLPVILMSAVPQPDAPVDRLFLQKPIAMDALISAVKSNMAG
ncbi:hypothetical protein BWR15_26180 [Pseudomonas sp. T]|nr:hypothetical protein BWR15_26180 [Pseudomonas sp. T]